MRFLAIACLVILAANPAAASPVVTSSPATVVRGESDDAPARGPRFAPVTVDLFCNFEVPQCATIHRALRELQDRHPDELRLVYRFAALPGDGTPLAEAAAEAWRQGCFFPLTDEVYAVGSITAAISTGSHARPAATWRPSTPPSRITVTPRSSSATSSAARISACQRSCRSCSGTARPA